MHLTALTILSSFLKAISPNFQDIFTDMKQQIPFECLQYTFKSHFPHDLIYSIIYSIIYDVNGAVVNVLFSKKSDMILDKFWSIPVKHCL